MTIKKYYLFTTHSCPKCPAMKKFIDENIDLEGEILDNGHINFMTMSEKYEVSEAPTFILVDEEENEIFRANDIYEIEEFIEE